jgi:hypothetical protein
MKETFHIMSIRKAVDTTEILVSAKDLFEEFGLPWNGHSSVKDLSSTEAKTARVPTKVGNKTCRLNQITLTEAGVQKLCKKHKRAYAKYQSLFSAPVRAQKDVNAEKEIARLNKTIEQLKNVVANLLNKSQTSKNSLSLKGKSVKVENTKLQAQARKEVRKVVEDYAKAQSDAAGLVNPDQRSIFYDLTYKSLYTEYQKRTPKHIDLKGLAEQKSKTGNKVSALQVAEQLGLAVELLSLAKSLFGTKN